MGVVEGEREVRRRTVFQVGGRGHRLEVSPAHNELSRSVQGIRILMHWVVTRAMAHIRRRGSWKHFVPTGSYGHDEFHCRSTPCCIVRLMESLHGLLASFEDKQRRSGAASPYKHVSRPGVKRHGRRRAHSLSQRASESATNAIHRVYMTL